MPKQTKKRTQYQKGVPYPAREKVKTEKYELGIISKATHLPLKQIVTIFLTANMNCNIHICVPTMGACRGLHCIFLVSITL